MSRFGTKEILNYWCDAPVNLDYNFIPGLQCETFGRREYYTDHFCGATYVWSEYLYNKSTKPKEHMHFGCSPYLYADAFVPERTRRGSLVVLPKWDIASELDFDNFKFEKFFKFIGRLEPPVLLLAPAEQREIWTTFFKLADIPLNVTSIADAAEAEEFQLGLAFLLSIHKNVCLSMFSSAVLYAYHNGANVIPYDVGHPYKEDPAHVVDTYAKLEPIHGEFEHLWRNNSNNPLIMDQLVKIFLSPHKWELPEDLFNSLLKLNIVSTVKTLKSNRTCEDYMYSNDVGTIDFQYLPESAKFLSKDEAIKRMHFKCSKYHNVVVSDMIKEMESRL